MLGLEKKEPPGVMSPEAAKLHSTATVFLVLNLVSIFTLCWLLGAFGTYQAYQATQEARVDNVDSAQASLRSAKICLGLNGAFLVLAIIIVIFSVLNDR
jgi:uncharacterized membrane protein